MPWWIYGLGVGLWLIASWSVAVLVGRVIASSDDDALEIPDVGFRPVCDHNHNGTCRRPVVPDTVPAKWLVDVAAHDIHPRRF